MPAPKQQLDVLKFQDASVKHLPSFLHMYADVCSLLTPCTYTFFHMVPCSMLLQKVLPVLSTSHAARFRSFRSGCHATCGLLGAAANSFSSGEATSSASCGAQGRFGVSACTLFAALPNHLCASTLETSRSFLRLVEGSRSGSLALVP